MKTQAFVPAVGFRPLTKFYDRIIATTLREEAFKAKLIEQAGIRAGHRVLDLGCGTGTLTILARTTCREAEVIGLDADPEILAIARAKALAAGLEIPFVEALSFAPPFPKASFDRIISSLLFHHLLPDDKRRTLAKLLELLGPGGELHVADWGKSQNAVMRAAFLVVQSFDGFATTTDSVRGLLPRYMEDAGFKEVAETCRMATVYGTLSFYRGAKS